MAEIQKFLFDRRFDRPLEPAVPEVLPDELTDREAEAPEPEPEPEPEPPPPTFSEEEVEAARQAGYTAGHADAADEAAAANGRMAALAMSSAAQALEQLARDHRSSIDTVSADVAHLVEVICRRILPFTCDRNAVAEIVALMDTILPQVLEEPRLILRVHPDVLDTVRAHMDPLAASLGYEGRLVIMPDTGLERSDCRIEWTDGGVERDTRRLWADIEGVVSRYAGDSILKDGPPPADPAAGSGMEPGDGAAARPGGSDAWGQEPSAPAGLGPDGAGMAPDSVRTPGPGQADPPAGGENDGP
ncbi:flagellar assembly protein FliH [Phaeovibrio sulfidiphilus]|uniref:Flagellar assembly protein FliH n=1 Tax=Phaeovibrio sulfidiphilus TaxID=1220600 RepID=A0A8J6YQC0_9PROT|nr:FliH/SctL family protein [Phaeovibrio sulfidiphilus]MBE1237766.1 flagellar assembly protein FliH [Phaeovibrio sulfidiphilus]